MFTYIQIENIDHEKKVERLNNRITDLGKEKIVLERKLKESNDECELLALQSNELLASKHTVEGKLEEMKGVTEEHVSQMASVILSKTEEIVHLQEKFKEVEEQLEIFKIQVSALCTVGFYCIKTAKVDNFESDTLLLHDKYSYG